MLFILALKCDIFDAFVLIELSCSFVEEILLTPNFLVLGWFALLPALQTGVSCDLLHARGQSQSSVLHRPPLLRFPICQVLLFSIVQPHFRGSPFNPGRMQLWGGGAGGEHRLSVCLRAVGAPRVSPGEEEGQRHPVCGGQGVALHSAGQLPGCPQNSPH